MVENIEPDRQSGSRFISQGSSDFHERSPRRGFSHKVSLPATEFHPFNGPTASDKLVLDQKLIWVRTATAETDP
jgi:hypothetical protein